MNAEDTTLHAELEERLRFETLIADLSSKFVNLPAGEVDREITDALRRICELLGLDIVVLWQLSPDAPGFYAPTHYCRAGCDSQSPWHEREGDYPWFREQLIAGRIVSFSSLQELPAEAARDAASFRNLGSRSNLSIPLMVGKGPMIGAFCLNATRAERDWPDALVKRLQLVAQVFTNALARKRAEQALRESEERMALAAEAAEVGVWGWNIARNHVWGSERWWRLFGFAAGEDVSFEKVIQRIHPEDRKKVEQEVQRALADGGDYAGEFRLVLPDRTERWIASRGRGYPDAGGKPAQMLGAATDITERKRTEEALRTSEARLAAGADLAGLGCYEVNYVELSSFADERFGAICGVPAGYQKGIQRVEFWMDRIHPDDRQRVLEERQRLHEGKVERYDVEYRYLHPAQGQKWLHHVGCVATRHADGRWIRAFGVVRDITERKRLLEQLRSAAGEWQTTFDSINDLMMILDCEYRILRVNAATVQFFGQPRERIVGSNCFTLMHGASCPVDGCPCQKSFQTKRRSELELFHTGSGKWLLISTDPIRDTAGEVIGAIHVGRDISERKRAEEELQRLRLHLWHTDRVAQTGAITASLAHELNQPLTGILSNAQAGLRFMDGANPDLEEIRAILTDIVHDDKRAGAVISGLRNMLRRKETQRERINLADTIEEVLVFMHSELVDQQIELRLRLEPDCLVLADQGQLQQVILNLVMNAVQAMHAQPAEQRRLELTLRRSNTNEVLVAVRDSGPGIPEDQQGKLFEAFWTTKNHGLGIGLHISRSIVESHVGRLSFTNNPDQGATFSFTLPLAVPAGPSGPGVSPAAGPGAL
jgi:PAS domain S-box-containing protein